MPCTESGTTRGRWVITKRDGAVWFMTGWSTGFGRALAKRTRDSSVRTVVTACDPEGSEILPLATLTRDSFLRWM